MAITDEENFKNTPGTAVTKKVEVVPYDHAWQARFQEIEQHLFSILTEQDVRVEHVGSTSVPGLAAKPIIDIDIVLQNGEDFEAVKNALEANGYTHIGDLGITGREVFKYEHKPQFMSHYLYALSSDSEELKRHRTFRDWLRSHPDDRDAYAEVKMAAAQRFPGDISAYIDAKSGIIFDIYQRCGLYQAQSLSELACSVANNRYNLRVVTLTCRQMQPGISLCEVYTEQGAFYLLAWEKAGSTSSEISLAQNTPESTKAYPLPTASGQPLCTTPFATFALFTNEQDALTFMTGKTWHRTNNL
jgi:GrpB-like predicted nucleotidyltransferase (UPF0157 family)